MTSVLATSPAPPTSGASRCCAPRSRSSPERGYPDTRIADVAERAGTSPALVIYYFKTKDQLLTEAIRYAEDTWYEAGTAPDGGASRPRPGGSRSSWR